MNVWQVVVQLGVSGLVVFVAYKLGMALIDRWATAELARAKATAEGFAALVGKVDAHHTADIQSHAAMGAQLAGISARLDERRHTPPSGVRVLRGLPKAER